VRYSILFTEIGSCCCLLHNNRSYENVKVIGCLFIIIDRYVIDLMNHRHVICVYCVRSIWEQQSDFIMNRSLDIHCHSCWLTMTTRDLFDEYCLSIDFSSQIKEKASQRTVDVTCTYMKTVCQWSRTDERTTHTFHDLETCHWFI
jgi:hypothetical protein